MDSDSVAHFHLDIRKEKGGGPKIQSVTFETDGGKIRYFERFGTLVLLKFVDGETTFFPGKIGIIVELRLPVSESEEDPAFIGVVFDGSEEFILLKMSQVRDEQPARRGPSKIISPESTYVHRPHGAKPC